MKVKERKERKKNERKKTRFCEVPLHEFTLNSKIKTSGRNHYDHVKFLQADPHTEAGTRGTEAGKRQPETAARNGRRETEAGSLKPAHKRWKMGDSSW